MSFSVLVENQMVGFLEFILPLLLKMNYTDLPKKKDNNQIMMGTGEGRVAEKGRIVMWKMRSPHR